MFSSFLGFSTLAHQSPSWCGAPLAPRSRGTHRIFLRDSSVSCLRARVSAWRRNEQGPRKRGEIQCSGGECQVTVGRARKVYEGWQPAFWCITPGYCTHGVIFWNASFKCKDVYPSKSVMDEMMLMSFAEFFSYEQDGLFPVFNINLHVVLQTWCHLTKCPYEFW